MIRRHLAAVVGSSVAFTGLLSGTALAYPAHHAFRTPSPAQQLALSKARAYGQIDGQIWGLRLANYVVNKDTNVAADASALSTELTGDITTLITLRSSVKSATSTTDVTAALATLSGYRITNFVLPRTADVVAADDLSAVATKFAATEATYSSAIDAASAAGTDVTAVAATYTDFVSKVVDLATQATAAHDAVIGLSVADYPGNATDLATARTALRTAGSDSFLAQRDARSIQRTLHLH